MAVLPAGCLPPPPPPPSQYTLTVNFAWDGAGTVTSVPAGINCARYIATDSTGNVTDSRNNRVQKFDRAGTFLTSWGSFGSAQGQFNGPLGIVVDGSNTVYVAESANNRIQVFDATGTFVTAWGGYGTAGGQFAGPWSLTIGPFGDGYVVAKGNNRIERFTG